MTFDPHQPLRPPAGATPSPPPRSDGGLPGAPGPTSAGQMSSDAAPNWSSPGMGPTPTPGLAPPVEQRPSPPLGGWEQPHPSDPPAGPPASPPRWRIVLGSALVGALVAAGATSAIFLVNDQPTTTVVQSRPAATLADEPLDIATLLNKVSPSVVTIKTGIESVGGAGEAAGSGIVVDDQGLILTNAHVIDGASSIEVSFSDGTSRSAELVGGFTSQDVALIRATGDAPTIPAELGSSDDLQVGDDVVAIGNALNLGSKPSVTKGIVSALDRSIAAQGVQLDRLVQTDAAINPGNSGGPLVNVFGQVVGINTAIIQDSQSVGFAISIDSAAPLIEDILDGKAETDEDQPFLGVETTNLDEVSAESLATFGIERETGAFIADIQEGTAAAASDLEPGDVIIGIDGNEIADKHAVGTAIRDKEPGDTIEITYERRGEVGTTTAELGRRGG